MVDLPKFNFKLDSRERRDLIKKKVKPGKNETLNSSKFEEVLYSYDLDHLYENKVKDKESIEEIFENFYKKFTKEIFIKLKAPKHNLFYKSGALFLSNSNIVTRSLSTQLGKVWEDVACLSEKVISPEKTFGNYKVKGIDIIIKENNELIFAQLKTAKDTLTGSQKSRSKKELSAFNKSMFIAAHDIGNWHFGDYPDIKRMAGEEFWEFINLDYSEITKNCESLFHKIEHKIKPEVLEFFNSSD